MDAITLLKQDHRTVDSLFQRYESGLAPEQNREVVEEIIRELSVHAVIEEQVLYPAMRRAFPGGDDLAEEGIDEHQEVKETLAELDGMDPTDGAFDQRVRSLIGDVRHHVEEEEEEMFPKLQQAVSQDQLDEMGASMETAKRVAPTRPHPHAPNTPPGNIIAGAVAGPVDRARDIVSGRAAKKTTSRKSTTKSTAKSTAKKATGRRSTAKKGSTRKSTTTSSAASRSRKTTGRTTSAKKAGSSRKSATRKATGRTAAKKTSARGAVIHVTPTRDGGWRAERAGSNRAVAKGDRKQDVVRQARDVAKRQNGRLVIHNAKGRIQEERTYGADPRRSRG